MDRSFLLTVAIVLRRCTGLKSFSSDSWCEKDVAAIVKTSDLKDLVKGQSQRMKARLCVCEWCCGCSTTLYSRSDVCVHNRVFDFSGGTEGWKKEKRTRGMLFRSKRYDTKGASLAWLWKRWVVPGDGRARPYESEAMPFFSNFEAWR